MDGFPRENGEERPPADPGDSRLWLWALAALFVWQAWMTLTLFGSDHPWDGMFDDRPVMSGQHPLHLYHGYLGARSFLQYGSLSSYDPAFQAGYPKTPVFDSGSRPAELFLTLAGGSFNPAAYKIGIAVCCLLAPLALIAAGRGLGLNWRATTLTVALGQLIWWAGPCRRAIDVGSIDLLFSSQAAVAMAGLLVQYHGRPGIRCWFALVLAGIIGWFAAPLFFALLAPVFLLWYLGVGVRHSLTWTLSLLAGLAVALMCNWFWLHDWVRYLWLRMPLSGLDVLLPHRTPAAVWRSTIWGNAFDRWFEVLLLVTASIGAWLLHRTGQRHSARLFGLFMIGLVALAVGGLINPFLGRFDTPDLFVPGLLFAVPLAAVALERTWQRLHAAAGQWAVVGLSAASAAAILVTITSSSSERLIRTAPLAIGLSPDQEALIETVRAQTTASARILWEDCPASDTSAHWTPLLPVLTDRHFLGGLDAEQLIEHTAGGLRGKMLAGKALAEWSDERLDEFSQRFNIGWIVCWSPEAIARFERWPRAEKNTFVAGAWLFTLRRPHSFILKGKARWISAEVGRIALADVEPEDGELILSLSHLQGLTATPNRAHVKWALDPRFDVPLVRLSLDAPAARLTLTWGN